MMASGERRGFGSVSSLCVSGDSHIVILKAFLDDSGGNRDDSVLVIAGAVGPLNIWSELEERWREELKSGGVPTLEGDREPYFRMADCRTGHGPFEGWEDSRRERLISRLADVIIGSLRDARLKLVGGSCGLPPAGPRRDYRREKLMVPYLRCLQNVFHACSNRIRRTGNGEYQFRQIEGLQQSVGFAIPTAGDLMASSLDFSCEGFEFIFAEHPEFDAATLEGYKRYRDEKDPSYRSILFALAKIVPGLQVADFIAHQFRQHCEDSGHSTETWKKLFSVSPLCSFVESHYEESKKQHDPSGHLKKRGALGEPD